MPAAWAAFDHTKLDDCHTKDLAPAKTHWTRPIDIVPFYGYALRPGITFTYLGLKVDETAAVRFDGKTSDNLFVTGEMMAGNVLGRAIRPTSAWPSAASPAPARRPPRAPKARTEPNVKQLEQLGRQTELADAAPPGASP